MLHPNAASAGKEFAGPTVSVEREDDRLGWGSRPPCPIRCMANAGASGPKQRSSGTWLFLPYAERYRRQSMNEK